MRRHGALGGAAQAWRLGEAPGASDAINEVGGGVDGMYVGPLELGQPGAIAGDGNTAAKLVGRHVLLGDGFAFDGTEPFTFELWALRVGWCGRLVRCAPNVEDGSSASPRAR